ncbi:exo-beta-N-acetylmuramidase NamZ domain-containing protein [Adhaeretor mobilis]|uniref:Esterase EstB n=1 Tax=Adhaeretor mobilis TaxID=1930276 RepID=A0A517MTR0_9BACT|nr:exo-beta-N-acetylmuramidase NamZ domain-containing protein [Adhaeretor mobilis]QDS98268.1 Esterase EstB [Adhaeretor mobilis]
MPNLKQITLLFVLVLLVSTSSLAKETPSTIAAPSPKRLKMDASQLERIDEIVNQQIEKGKLPGCVVAIGRRDGIAFAKAFGNRRLEPSKEKMTLDTVFDMASITKPVATATSIMILVDRGLIRLRDPVAEYLPEFGKNGKAKITIEQLLTHQGGLVPDNPLGDYQHGVEQAWENIWELKPSDALGKRFVYTDVGFIVLAKVVEKVTGQTVAEFAAKNTFQPLGMSETGYLPAEALRARAATTEQREGRWMRGEVHDPRAYLLGGVAGHAGLFSTASDLSRYARMMLCAGSFNGSKILSPATYQEMIKPRDIAGQLRSLGWDSRSKYSSNRGENFSAQAFGHGGFTGNALWIDPQLDLFVIFLSNRVHPDGTGSVNGLAGRIGTIAAGSIIGKPLAKVHGEVSARPVSEVLNGIDVLEKSDFKQLAGSRVGLITNHTGLNRTGVRTIDLLHAAENVELVTIFSPEHGLQGKLDIANIDHTTDSATGLPVYSLYGESRKPAKSQLQEIDTLVFDIQDIGCRFYTYISTMGLAMETAAEQDLRFVVLDRPNPLGGVILEGPLLDEGKESFVGFHTIPLRHGMSAGELATMFRKERDWGLDLDVIKTKGWHRQDYWDRTGLTWVNPSPNMRSLTQAVLYPGVGFLETTNVSVGRGTDTPFEVVGAPWIDGQQLSRRLNEAHLPGVRFVPIRFTPDSSKHAGQECEGVNIICVNRQVFRSVPVGLELAIALHELYPEDWDTARLDHLLNSDRLLNAIREGKNAAEIRELYQADEKSFRSRRQPFLLYR